MKKLAALFLAGALYASLAVPALAAGEGYQQYSSVRGLLTDAQDTQVTLSTSAPFDMEEFTATLLKNSLLIDGATGGAIQWGDLLLNQPAYVYPDHQYEGFLPNALAVVANIPQDMAAPLFITVQDIQFQEDGTGTITAAETGDTYQVTADTQLHRLVPYGYATILSIPVLPEIQPGMKVLISADSQGVLGYCSLTNHALSAPQVLEGEALTLNGTPSLLPPATANGELYLPLAALGEAFGLPIGWQENPEAASVTVDGTVISLPIGTEHYLLNDRTYVPQRFVEQVLGLTVITEQDGFAVE